LVVRVKGWPESLNSPPVAEKTGFALPPW